MHLFSAELFVNWMKPLNASFESFLIYEHDLYPADDSLDTFDLFIVTGSRTNAYDGLDYRNSRPYFTR